MQNIDVHFRATSNFQKVRADMTALRAQVAAMDTLFKSRAYASGPAIVDAEKWKNGSRAVHEASNAYRAAASSSGLLTTQQIRATSEAENYTKALQKQKLTFSQMRKHSGVMKQVYADQLRYQRMTAQYWGTDAAGRAVTDITIPKNIPRELNTIAQRTYFVSQMAKSASHQFVNMGKNIQWGGRQLMVGLTYPVALFGAAAGAMAYKVEDGMTRVAKVYDLSAAAQQNEAAKTKELNELRVKSFKIAEDTAKSYGMSIEDTLEIEERLAATGKRGDLLFKSTKEVSRIATLGDLDIGQSTDMTIALQGAFKDTIKTGEDLADTFNYMNAVENATSLSLQDIAQATPRAAAGLASLGVNAKEMTVLLVAMREAGVRAAEGANALKTAGSRILNEQILNKATEKYKEAGADIDLVEISKESEANFLKFVQLLSKAEGEFSGMERWQKKAARSALFGAHQYSRLSAVIANVGDASGQAGKAMDLMNTSTTELAGSAQEEIDQKMKNVSGRFKSAWQSLRGDLAEMGQPFLEFATMMLEVAGKSVSAFNNLGDTVKKFLTIAVGLGALAGPAVMLVGLFANLAGHFIKVAATGVSGLSRLAGAVGLVNKEERSATLSAQSQNEVMMQQQKAVSTLTQELQVLTAAYKKANEAAMQYMTGKGGGRPPAPGGPTTTNTPQGWAPSSGSTANSPLYVPPVPASPPLQTMLANQTRLRWETAQEARLRTQIAGQVTKASLGTAAMSASIAGMMMPGDGLVQSMSKWLMITTLVVPMLKMAGNGIVNVTQSILNSTKATAGLGAANAAAATTSLGAWQRVRANITGIGQGILKVLGPGGVIAVGIMAVGGGLMMWRNHLKKIREEQARIAKAQANLVKSTDLWAESIGRVVNGYKRYSAVEAPIREKKEIASVAEFYESKEFKDEREEYDKMGEKERKSFDQLKFVELMRKYGMTAKEARTHMIGFFDAMGEGALDAEYKANALREELGNINKIDIKGPLKDGLDNIMGEALDPTRSNNKEIKALGKQWGDIFADAFQRGTPAESKALYNMLEDSVLEPWDKARKKLQKTGLFDGAEWLRSAKALQQKYYSMTEEEREKFFKTQQMNKSGVFIESDVLLSPLKDAEQFENALMGGAVQGQNLNKEIKTLAQFTKEASVYAKMLNYHEAKETTDALISNMLTMQDIMSAANPFDEGLPEFVGPLPEGMDPTIRQQLEIAITGMSPTQLQNLETVLFKIADAQGIKRGANALETYDNIFNGVKKGAKDAGEEVEDVKKKMKDINDVTATIRIKQVGGIVQSAMSSVQSRMANSAMDQFNSDWDSRMESAQNSWDSRQDALQSRHEAVQRGMERSQENAQDAFENRWERRREIIEKTYEQRKKAVDKAIKQEQRADEIRQRLFEREKARLERLADLANTNIDFNTAMIEGNLDEAAKTLNNASAKSAIEQMEAEEKAAERRSQKKIERLEKKNERLEKQRDRELENLDKLEERMRKHLDRVQDARRRALEKQQEQEVKALEKSQEAAMDSLDKQRKYEEATLRQRLDLFLAYTARNKRDLERWMKQLGLKYDDFGDNIEKKGKSWAKTMRESLLDEIRKAGKKVKSDNLWEKVGESMGNKMLRGLGFSGMKEFRRFVNTGKMGGGGGGGGNRGNNGKNGRRGKGRGPNRNGPINRGPGGAEGVGKFETRHDGGVVGSGGSSRGNIPNTYKGLHRSETMVRAQKGEYVVNKDATAKHKPMLDILNKGKNLGTDAPLGPNEGGSGFGGPAGFMSGVIANMFRSGVEKAFQNKYEEGVQKQNMLQRAAAIMSGVFRGSQGEYGGRAFSSGQMRNAATIASVGSSMGMSKRDLIIGIMTAIAESGLVNVKYGDRDSQGLFQQRPSMGWGTIAQVTDPEYASRKFFSVLKGVSNRDEMSPWMAAQTVQRSAFADGSNYRRWWEAAQAIFGKGLDNKKGGGGYKPGGGGKHQPIRNARGRVTRGLHGSGTFADPNAVDMAIPTGTPIYAVADGRISDSYDIRGSEPRASHGGLGYRSFGRVVRLDTGAGNAMYAHLSRRSVRKGQRVKGGSTIGYSGNTGYSTGPHLHFAATNGPYAWLRKGGEIKYDNTQVVAHRGETMLSAPVTRQLKENIASGGPEGYNVTIDLRGAYIKEEVDIEKAVNAAIDKKETKLGRKRVVK